MGRNLLARVKLARSLLPLGCLCVLVSICLAQPEQNRLLLVASEESQLGPFTHAELRKVFLGIPVTRDSVRVKPLLNTTDSRATSIFLQQVVFMSERDYRRQLLSRVFRLGDQRPREYDNIELLAEALRNTPGSLTYMWSDQFDKQSGLESLGELWASSSN